MLCQVFFARADILSEKSILFGKKGLIKCTSFEYKTSRLVTISLLISALNNRVLLFSWESYFIKALQNVFPVFALAGLGEFLTIKQTLDCVLSLHNCLEFSQPLLCLYQAMQTQKTFSIA